MEIKIVKIEDLKFADYNPRQISDSQFKKLRDSIKEFGFVEPVVVNEYEGRENVIIGGHMRVRAAKEEGIKEIPCHFIKIDPVKEKILNIALNRISGSWDESKLAELVYKIGEEGGNIKLSGLEDLEIKNLIDEGTMKVKKDDPDDFDSEVEYDAIKEADSKEGEVYILGEHRLMCGERTIPAHVEKLMDGQKARMIFMDPPYNVNYSDDAGRKIKNDNMESGKFYELLEKVFINAFNFSTKDCTFYICHATSTADIFKKALEAAQWAVHHVIIWVKEHFVLSQADYHRIYEPIMYGWKDEDGKFFDIWRIKRDSRNTYQHPNQKPIKLAMRAMFNNSERGDIVMDLFGGSGSTLVAAEKLGRKACLMELDPKYCDVIRKRWELLKAGEVKQA